MPVEVLDSVLSATYSAGNPLPLTELEDGDYKTPSYLKGQKLHRSGKAPVKDAAFIQIMGLEAGARTVASISRDLVWDGQTPIEKFEEALAEELVGKPIEPMWFGPYQFTVYVEGDLDPEELVRKLVYSPPKVYASHMPSLLSDAQEDVPIYEHDFLRASYAKGRKFVDIFYGRASGQETALQMGQGRGFVWSYKKTDTDELAGKDLDGEDQTITELVNTDLTDQDMRESLLETQDLFKGVKGSRRWVIRFTFDPTRTCCLYATAAQSEGTSYPKFKLQLTGDFVDSSPPAARLLTSMGIFVANEKEKTCRDCKKKKESDSPCDCGQKT